MIIKDGNGAVVTIGGEGENSDDFITQQEKHDQKIERERIKRGYSKEGAVNYSVDGEKYLAVYSDL